MKIESLSIDGPLLITPKRIKDERGFFSEIFRGDLLESRTGPVQFVQENLSRSTSQGTIRGLHYQAAPRGQAKLVRVSRGAVLDVAVDCRPGSTTFGRHVAVELDEDAAAQLWIPDGFLHGFCTLTPQTELIYKVTDYYSAAHDRSVAFNDPAIGIDWPVASSAAILSAKDLMAPLLKDAKPSFVR